MFKTFSFLTTQKKKWTPNDIANTDSSKYDQKLIIKSFLVTTNLLCEEVDGFYANDRVPLESDTGNGLALSTSCY